MTSKSAHRLTLVETICDVSVLEPEKTMIEVLHRVLLVDDSTTARRLVSVALSFWGVEVVEAVDGLDGLSKIEANPEISLVLCDVNMPRMSGLEMFAQARADHAFRDLSFVLMSASRDAFAFDVAVELGAEAWIEKPFSPNELGSVVHSILERQATGVALRACQSTLLGKVGRPLN